MGINSVGAATSLMPLGVPVNWLMVVPAAFLNVAVTPGTRWPTPNTTLSLKPFLELRVMVVLPLAP